MRNSHLDVSQQCQFAFDVGGLWDDFYRQTFLQYQLGRITCENVMGQLNQEIETIRESPEASQLATLRKAN